MANEALDGANRQWARADRASEDLSDAIVLGWISYSGASAVGFNDGYLAGREPGYVGHFTKEIGERWHFGDQYRRAVLILLDTRAGHDA